MNFRTRRLTIALAATALLATIQGTQADETSMLRLQRGRRVDPYLDQQASRVGDLLTILILEDSVVDNNDTRALSRESKKGGGLNFSMESTGDFPERAADATYNADMQSRTSFDGSARFSSDRGIRDRLTVRVRHVLPNGVLVVAGQRRTFVAQECRTLTISGYVRPQDIKPDNTIESRYVADMKLATTGHGPDTEHTRQGWLGALCSKLWPY